MWQRIAATKAVAGTPWIGMFCATAATAVAVSVSHNATSTADALSHPVSSRGGLPNGAYAAFLDATSIHRTGCDAAAPSRQRSPSQATSSSRFWPSFLSSSVRPTPPDHNYDYNFNCNYDDDPSFEKVTEQADRYTNEKHAIMGTLLDDSMIAAYEIYRPTNPSIHPVADGSESNLLVLVATVKFGTHVNGHGGLVHGGILGLMFDDAMGCGSYEVLLASANSESNSNSNANSNSNSKWKTNPPICVTANLNIDFRRPVPEGTAVRIEVVLERWEGRKFFLTAKMLGVEPEPKPGEEDVLYAEATSLYILLKDKN